MDKGEGHCALADGGGDAFDRSVADVAGDEQAGLTRFEEQRRAFERPCGLPLAGPAP